MYLLIYIRNNRQIFLFLTNHINLYSTYLLFTSQELYSYLGYIFFSTANSSQVELQAV